MSEPTPNKSKVTLEDLLRLKRHERPSAEYWVRFDRELNERVWRALAEPVESRASIFLGRFGRQARWLALGAVPVLALALAWHGNAQIPVKLANKTPPSMQVASTTVKAKTAPPVGPALDNNAQALAVLAQNNLPALVQPALVAAEVLDSKNVAGFHKVPAMLAFATSDGAGVRYASDALANPAFSARLRGSAY